MKILSLLFLAVLGFIAVCNFAAAQQQSVQYPQIANGFMGTYINASRLYIAGLTSGQGDTSNRAPVPANFLFQPQGGVPIVNANISGSGVSSIFNQNIETGEAWILWNVPAASGVAPPNCVVGHKRFAHRLHKNVFVEQLSVTWDNSQVANESSAFHLPISSQTGQIDTNRIKLVNITQQIAQNVWVETYETLAPEVPVTGHNHYVVVVREVPPAAITILPSAGGSMTAHYPAVVVTTLPYDAFDVRTDRSRSLADVAVAMWINYTTGATPERRNKEHVDAWKALWDSGRISYTSASGDLSIDNTIQNSQYALFCSLRDDWPYSTSPGGVPNSYYESSTFWDMETWMAPVLLMFHPEIVRVATIQYRLDRLAGALNNAQVNVLDTSTGVKCPECAAFPWQSCYSGTSCCPWAEGTESENHITADVVLLWQQYYLLTNDRATLLAMWPLLKRTADFWLARSTQGSDGKYHIDGITPPDEYHFGNDSVYTNFAAAKAVNFSIDAAFILGYNNDPSVAAWQSFAQNVAIVYDAVNDYHPEFLNYQGDKVKQADVILLNYPLAMQMETPNTARNDLIYYEQRTDPLGPAMTWAFFSVGYNSIHDRSTANTYFYKGYKQNVFPPFFQWSEVAGGGGCQNFLTGSGGFLQSVIFGLGSMRISQNHALTFDLSKVNLLNSDDVLKFHNLRFQGSWISIEFTASDAAFSSVTATFIMNKRTTSDGGIQVALNGTPLNVGQAVPVTYSVGDPDSAKYIVLSLT